ncbi:MAG: membrane protein insertase YidC [Chloroflexota bacterium]|nr:membrane protein insertase YidC [Chloroflexota bacterium]
MSSWFQFISEPMAHALVFLAQNVFGAGVAIIIFTLGIKLLLVPLTLQQLRSARNMQELQPEIQELQRKYKNDKQRLTEETMALYKERKVNPAAGCLPLVLQLPILYGLYGALLDLGNNCASKVAGQCVPHALYNPLFTQPFLWLHNLAQPDQLHILPIITVVAQWVQQRMMTTQKSTEPQQAAMQSMMQFMPLMIGVFSWNLAAGLPLYWAVSTIFAIVQQYFITGWGSLKVPPSLSLSGLGGLLGGPASQNGASPDTRQAKRPAQATKGRKSPSAGSRQGGGRRASGKR